MLVRPPTSPRRQRSALFRLLVVLTAVAKLSVLLLGAAAEASEGRTLGAHAEPWGPAQHATHDELSCAACVAHHLVGPSPRAIEVPPPAVASAGAPPVTVASPHPTTRTAPPSVRGPPLLG